MRGTGGGCSGVLEVGALEGSASGAVAVTRDGLPISWISKCWSSTAATCLQLIPTGQLQ